MNKHHILEYNNQFDQKHKITEYFSIEKRLSCQECFSGFHKFMPAIVYQVDKIILFADCYNNLITALQFIRLNS